MAKQRKLAFIILIITVLVCIVAVIACTKNEQNEKDDTTLQQNTTQTTATNDALGSRVAFGKKYYALGYSGYTENEYYVLNEDGSASYNHIMKDGDTVTFHQVINFRWAYKGEGDCILLHNGTHMIKGTQDDVFGICRVMHVNKDVIYWSASGENSYYISEDFIDQIPYYAEMI